MLALAFVSFLIAQEVEAPPATPAETTSGTSGPASSASAPAMSFDDGAFNDGMSYYNRFEFEKASFRFRAATRAEGKPPAELARAHLWLGLALAQAGDEVGAREEFAQAIALDSAIDLPPDAPPTIRPLFDDARANPLASSKVGDGDGQGGKGSDVVAPKKNGALPLTTLVGAGVAGAGVLAFAGGAIVGAVAVSQADAANQERFQDDAIAAHEEAAGTAVVANALLVTGVAASVAGAAVVVAGALLE